MNEHDDSPDPETDTSAADFDDTTPSPPTSGTEGAADASDAAGRGGWWGDGPASAAASDAASEGIGASTAVLDDTSESPAGDQPPPPPPPGPGSTGPGPAPIVPGLVRDPNATFGGVLSGLAHRYAWSVAAVRLAFVALLFVSFGAALLLYLAAWVIVPRATYWPPAVVRNRGERLSNRDLGVAVAAVGLIAFLVVGADGAGAVLVPLVLVGAGIWLLVQPARDDAPEPAATRPAAVPSFATPPPVGQPVPPRRRRRWVLRIVLAGLIVFVLASVAAAVAIVRGGADGFNLTFGDDRLVIANYVPETLDDLPNEIEADVGGVRVDLTDLRASELADRDEPFELTIDIDDGAVDLRVPADLDVSIDATIGDGDIDLSGAQFPGADETRQTFEVDAADPDMIITIDVGDGDIDIRRER